MSRIFTASVDSGIAVAVVTFTNVLNRFNDTTLDFPGVA